MDSGFFVVVAVLLTNACTVKSTGEEESLQEHNRLRALHGSPKLSLSMSLSADCEKHAADMAAKKDLFHSNTEGKYGENLCMSTKPDQCVQDWYDEIMHYNFDNPVFSTKTGHFTALVWKSSTEMGYGQAKGSNGAYYVVARYKPTGNVVGQFSENVFPRKRRGNGKSMPSIRSYYTLLLISFLIISLAGLRSLV